MNKQGPSGIEWTDYTWNPVGGCGSGCQWVMPDGKIAKCYAEAVAQGVASKAYPHGFNHFYFHPDRLDQPLKVKIPAKIFLDSMGDLMSPIVPTGVIQRVLDVVRQADWHTFQLLTKNPKRLTQFELPTNLWVGVSMPPSIMNSKRLSQDQQERYIFVALDVLRELDHPIGWMSLEPLSFDLTPIFLRWIDKRSNNGLLPFKWAVIGAASHGRTYYQPKQSWILTLLYLLDSRHIPVFFKGNLTHSPYREEYPAIQRIGQLRLEL